MALRLNRGSFFLFQLFEDLITEALYDNVIHLGLLINVPLVNVLDLDVTEGDSCRLPMVLYFEFR